VQDARAEGHVVAAGAGAVRARLGDEDSASGNGDGDGSQGSRARESQVHGTNIFSARPVGNRHPDGL